MWTRIRALAEAPLVVADLAGLARYVRRHRIQVIHATEKPRDALYATLLKRVTGARCVIHMHVSYGEWLSPIVKWALAHADAIVGVSNFTARTITDAGYPPARVFVVHNSLEIASWDPSIEVAHTRTTLGIPPDAPVLGIFARLFAWKGHAYVLDALSIVRNEFPDIRLLIVGKDDPRAHPGGGSYRTELERQAQRLGLLSNIVFTGFRTDVPRLMAAIDVFTLPSWEEPFGLVFLEAMAMRKPVVAWDSGGAPEVVRHGQTGLLVPRGSVSGLAEAMLALLRDPALRRRLGDEGRRDVEERFNPQRMCESMVAVYRAILRST